MTLTALPVPARDLIGPDALGLPESAGGEDLTNALKFAGGIGPKGEPGAYAFTGKDQASKHFCELDGDAYRWCSRIPAGGLTYCLVCGIPIFVPPETCLERLEPAAVELEVDPHAGTRRFTR